ncbi:hypothetical protein B4U79_00153 [Dinothrombium tinctorium]|uniref:Uncharacterized protein n=1 Tax=Dinothrombium tinctorium TaxID=1965070 RepID=A0A443RBM0_9ACAR|nr:hypothetical protein B4U79_00153 [Dinothrombium tinctorium]
MVMAIDTLTRLCPGILFDWRLYAERGSPRYFHHHTDGRRIDDCEIMFIRKMSDDERLSLTTAISDDDDGESRDSPYRAKSGAAAAAFQCTGAVRKAGFLSVKKWLLRKRHQVELARKRGWKGYWVCLKGTTLLFYPCDSRDGRAIESKPRHLIIIDGAIMQPIPEHPKRDFIFCLSTAFGDAYLFQAPCQVELENWIAAIHNACGAAFARHRGKTGTLHLLQEEIHRIDQQVESDAKLKHMAELQLTVVADYESRKQLQEQIKNYEESLEQFHCEQFRLRCYMASIQGTELPNPKTLLAHVSKPTKAVLNRLGVFTVSSFHAYICARSPSMLTNIISARGGTRRRGPSLVAGTSSSSTRSLSRHSSLSSRQGSSGLSRSAELPGDKYLQVMLPPDDQIHVMHVRGTETVEDLLWMSLNDKQILPSDYFIRVKRVNSSEFYVPSRHEIIDHLPVHDYVQICAKILYQVELSRHSVDQLFGFSVEAELVENATDRHNQDELCVYVSRVEEKSLASAQGLAKGDEIMVINGAIVSDLDMMYIESVLQEELSLCMMLRSCRTEPPELCSTVRSTDEYIESLVCPPPPSDGHITDEMIGKLIVPSPLWVQERNRVNAAGTGSSSTAASTVKPAQGSMGSSGTVSLPLPVSGEQIAETLLKTAEQVTSEYSKPQAKAISDLKFNHPTSISQQSSEEIGDTQYVPRRPPLSDADKLRKVIRELVDTERTYVEHLNNLLETYLEPMKQQSLASNQDINTLFGNIQEIVHFQRTFLESLEEGVRNEGDAFDRYSDPSDFKNVLFSLGNSFLLYADKFKLYSSFCASHSKAAKILHPSNESAQNPALIEFLNSRSRGQHAYSLESYLIKPIQRILKYPLLLQQLKHLTDSNSDEHKHLSQALKGMERVAEHINEMQRIHEEYGAIFDHLQRQHLKSSKQMIELSPVELLYYGGVDWMNITEFLGKIKKGIDLHTMCFVFKQAVVFLCKERIRQKKKLVVKKQTGVSNKVSEVEIIRYQVLIPVTEVQVRATSVRSDINTSNEPGTATTHFLWELIHLRCTQMSGGTQRRTEKVYQLSNSTNEFRNCFLRTIRQIIRESVRNMAVPTTKSSTVTKPIVHQSSSGSTSSANQAMTTNATTTTTSNQSQVHVTTTVAAATTGSTSQASSSLKETPQSQSSSSSTQATKSAEKPAVKQKPLPPPRAPTTTKSSLGPTLTPQSSKEREHTHSHGKQTVSCGLCGADVGLGPSEAPAARSSLRSSPAPDTDKSDHSSSSGKAKLLASGKQSVSEREESQESMDENNASPIWEPRESSR